MKNKILTLTVIGFMTGIVFMGCQNTEEKNSQQPNESMVESKPDSQAVQTSYSDEWQSFKSTSEQKIQDNENSIAAFKVKMKKSGTKVKAKYNIEIANLVATNRAMKKKLEEYKNDGKSAWEDFKSGFNKDMDKLGKAVKNLTSDNH
jgi:hypothetical protein